MSGPRPELAPVLRRTRTARRFLHAALAVIAVRFLWDALGMVLMGGVVSVDGWDDWWDPTTQALFWVAAIVTFPTALAVLRAERSLLRHLLAQGVNRLETGVTGATLAWFVPILNLFLPLRSFRELATVTGPRREAALRPALDAWWGCWVFGTIANRILQATGDAATTPRSWILVRGLQLGADILMLAAGALLVAILRRLAEDQAELAMLRATHGEDRRFDTARDLAAWWHWKVRPEPPPDSVPLPSAAATPRASFTSPSPGG